MREIEESYEVEEDWSILMVRLLGGNWDYWRRVVGGENGHETSDTFIRNTHHTSNAGYFQKYVSEICRVSLRFEAFSKWKDLLGKEDWPGPTDQWDRCDTEDLEDWEDFKVNAVHFGVWLTRSTRTGDFFLHSISSDVYTVQFTSAIYSRWI